MNERSARALLGVSLSATTGQIKRAYRRLALELHPDQGGDPLGFQRLVEAQHVLLALPAGEQSAVTQLPVRPQWVVAEHRSVRGRTAPVARRRPTAPKPVNERRFGDVLAEKLAAA